MTISLVGVPTLSTPEKALIDNIQAEIDAFEGVATTHSSTGEVPVTGLLDTDGILLTPQAACELFYVTVAAGKFTVKAQDDNAPITSVKFAWRKV